MLLFVAITAVSLAQNTPADRAKAETEIMAQLITLTPEQKEKMLIATTERITAADALRKEAGPGNKPDAEKMKLIAEKWNNVFKESVSNDLRVIYWKKLEERNKTANN